MDDRGNSLRRQLSNKNSVPGRDLTFSAPKSVSLLALVRENQQIIAAHRQSVDRALKYVEQNCIFTRIGKGGRIHQQTDNIAVAIFEHHDSRNLEPNLHTHCVIFNQTQGPDGKWRSMDNRQLYRQQMTIGMIYHHELSQRLMELGYSINWNQDGTFDIAGFKPSQLQQFSSRRAEIISIAGADGSSKSKALACISTRNNKKYVSAEERKALRESWQHKYNSLNLATPEVLQKINIEPGESEKETPKHFSSLRELIDRSIQALSIKENKTYFSQPELLKEVLIAGQGQYKLDLIQNNLKQHPSLLGSENNGAHELKTINSYRKQREGVKVENRRNLTSLEPNILQLATSTLSTRFAPQQSLRKIDKQSSSKKFSLEKIFARDNRWSQTVRDYLQRDEQQQSKTVILTDTEADKHEITSHIRQELIRQNKLGSDPVRAIALQPKNIEKSGLTEAQNYRVGDAIKFNRQSAKFSDRRFYKVLAVDERNKVLHLGDRFGNKIDLPLHRYQNREVFEVKTRELRINEKLKFDRGQYINGKQVFLGQSFTITEIKDKQTITIKTKGKQSIVKTSDLFFASYNYADTLKRYRGKQIERCIYYPSIAKSNQLSQQDIYRVASLVEMELTVYTSDIFGQQTATKQTQQSQKNMEIKEQSQDRSIDTSKTIDDTLFELASSAKYTVINEGDLASDLSNKKVYYSPDGVMIEKDPQNLSIYYDGKSVEFDRDFNVVKNDFSEREIYQLTQKTQEIKQKSLEQNRRQQIQRGLGLFF